jgi:hypothetical protein
MEERGRRPNNDDRKMDDEREKFEESNKVLGVGVQSSTIILLSITRTK